MFIKTQKLYAHKVYQALCGANGYLVYASLKANIKQNKAFDDEDKKYFDHLQRQDFLDPCKLRVKKGAKLKAFYKAIKKRFKTKQSSTKRLQFDTVAILRRLRRMGFEVVDIINNEMDVFARNTAFQILLRKDDMYLLLEDDYSDRGSTLKLYSGRWTAIMLSNKQVDSLKKFYTIRHDPFNKNNYIVRISDAVKFAIKE